MTDHIGPAKTFISYAQAGKWGDLIAAIMDGGADLERPVWLDVFGVRQWPSDSPDLDFASTIGKDFTLFFSFNLFFTIYAVQIINQNSKSLCEILISFNFPTHFYICRKLQLVPRCVFVLR